jgi:hypothetical protein
MMKQAPLFDDTPQEIHARRKGEEVPLLVSCGLGVNSTAMLILLYRLGDRPDAVLFADTGGERPETYAYRDTLSAWLESVGFPPVTTVKRTTDHDRQKSEQKYDTLEEECLAKKCLPSIAYYHRSCSYKWKQQPQEKWANGFEPCLASWTDGLRCVKAIGYDADEGHRLKRFEDAKWVYWHPLVDYGWGRDECLKAIEEAGLPAPLKSSCWFCPEMRPEEVFDLGRAHPQLLDRALAMEANAVLTDIKGLGKHEYSWRELVAGAVPVPDAADLPPRMACVCYDG